jgi:hypothetical protein
VEVHPAFAARIEAQELAAIAEGIVVDVTSSLPQPFSTITGVRDIMVIL